MAIGRIITTDGSDIEISQVMLEDFSVLSIIYEVSVKDLIRHVFDCEFDAEDAVLALKRMAG